MFMKSFNFVSILSSGGLKKTVLVSEELIRKKIKELEVIQETANNCDLEAENGFREEVNGLLEQEETKWRQRAKEKWLRHGDRNTNFFHAGATQRKSHNLISKIVDAQGRECNTLEGIEQAFVSYYKALFTSANPQAIEECTSAVERNVTPAMAFKLLSTFSVEEVAATLK
jgi:hypothetical protein